MLLTEFCAELVLNDVPFIEKVLLWKINSILKFKKNIVLVVEFVKMFVLLKMVRCQRQHNDVVHLRGVVDRLAIAVIDGRGHNRVGVQVVEHIPAG